MPTSHPSITATALWESSNRGLTKLLSAEESSQLAAMASVVRFKKGELIYAEGTHANAAFNIIDGAVKTYRAASGGREQINGFLFADDLFGLAEEGRYVNSAKAVTNVTAYRFPVSTLEPQLHKNGDLEFGVISKLCHELREAQWHALLLGKRNALAKVAMFLQVVEHGMHERRSTRELYLPMNRSDIAAYTGMSLEAVSRSFQMLIKQNVIAQRDRRHIVILDRAQLHALAALR